jgi:hypothetical protein
MGLIAKQAQRSMLIIPRHPGHQELSATLGSDADSEDSVQYWVALFQSGNTSCEDILRPGKHVTGLTEPFRLFPQNFPFASASMLSRHFSVYAASAKKILVRDLGLKKFTRQWVPHTLSGHQKVTRGQASNELLQILNDLEADSFDGTATGDESWFHYLYESSAIFVKSPGDVSPRTRKEINVKKTVFTIFFTNRKFLIAEYLPKGQKCNEDYFA